MYQAANDRYEKMAYVRCGKSGLKLPAISLDCGTTLEIPVFMRI